MPCKDSTPKRSLLLMAAPTLMSSEAAYLEAVVHAGMPLLDVMKPFFVSGKDFPNADDVETSPRDEEG